MDAQLDASLRDAEASFLALFSKVKIEDLAQGFESQLAKKRQDVSDTCNAAKQHI